MSQLNLFLNRHLTGPEMGYKNNETENSLLYISYLDEVQCFRKEGISYVI